MWKYAKKWVLLHIKRWETSGNEITYHSCFKSKSKEKFATLREVCEKKFSELQISELFTSFSISIPASLLFKIVLITMRDFFVVNTIVKARDQGTLSHRLTSNSLLLKKIKNYEFINGKRWKFLLILLEVLEDSWGSVGELLETGGDKFPRFL